MPSSELQPQLSIIPISIGRLPSRQAVSQAASVVADLISHLEQQHSAATSAVGGPQVVLIATSDYTHAGPYYGELPPPGMTLTDYMMSKDMPVIQVTNCR